MIRKPKNSRIVAGARNELGMSISDFCDGLGVSRQTYYDWIARDSVSAETMRDLVIRHFPGWQAKLAVNVLRNMGDERMIPCFCIDSIHDNGDCPKHGVVPGSMVVSVREVVA